MGKNFISLEVDTRRLDRLRRGLRNYRVLLRDALKKAVTSTVLEIEAEAKERCPVDTGLLRSSITPEVVNFDQGIVGTNVEYAPHVEYGTRNTTAQPFMEPAFRKGEKAARKYFDDAFDRLDEVIA